MNLYSEFTKYCRFWFKIFQNVMWKNSIFLTSEARLSPNLQNWTKLLRFYNSGLSGQLSFCWASWKSLGLNYSTTKATAWTSAHPSFFRGVKFEVGWNFEHSLGGQRGPPWDPQKPKKKIFHGEIFTPYFHWDLNLGPLVEVKNQEEEKILSFSSSFL